MALKDITLGQYFPGTTIIHRLDPRVKIIGTTAYTVALFLAKRMVSSAICRVPPARRLAVPPLALHSTLRGMQPICI